ncbi:glycosyltransferase [Clostridium sp. UBA4548]|uniref:glycosyltransferase n=1 Tax=Clostridium sp. UBA4548 TaxID=1946361 RepID=UPI0025BE07BC|nr:glycosyltransferase [Clostridium sp. UBA4548]
MNNEVEIIKREIKDNIINLINSNRLAEAKELIGQYKLKVIDDLEISSIMAVIYINEGKFNEAEQILRDGLKQQSNNFDLMYNLAYLYENTDLKCLPLALSYYKRCWAITEDNDHKTDILNKVNNLKMKLVTLNESDRPLVSIVVLAYNQLEYTKLCIESIYKYTSNTKIELITVNNGSSDGTKAYFSSLSNVKNINIVNNVRPVDGFNAGIESAEGKYTACVCNDFIFTENWLDNLLKCIESDESIGFVSPGANLISNNQRIDCSYSSIDEMQMFAKNYNMSDSSKWEERIKLLPCVLLCRSNLLKDIGGYDPRFYYGEFADDDISFRIRRLGYKLIYAGDTFTHHAGSITTEKDHVENNSIAVSREIFINKHHIDPPIESTFNSSIVNTVNYKRRKNINILGINTFCGGTPLQVKNKFKNLGLSSVKITSLTEANKYMEDLKTVSEEVYCIGNDKLEESVSNKNFDIIIYENGIENVKDINNTISILKSCLNEGGQFIFAMYNESYYQNLFCVDDYEKSLYSDGCKSSYLNLHKIVDILSNSKFSNISIDRFVIRYNKELVKSLVSGVLPETQKNFQENITTYKFIISCEV